MPSDAAGPSDTGPPEDVEGEERPLCVLPLLTDPGNRRVLVDWLDDRYEVLPRSALEAGDDGPAIDLFVLDPRSFVEHAQALRAHKEAAFPRVVPYLLVLDEDRPLPTRDVGVDVDDVIVAPISQRELDRRLAALGRLRRLSVELDRRKDELAVKNEQLEYLMAAAAHDLRNPLNVAIGSLPELTEGKAVTRINRAVDRMQNLVDTLLAASRAASGIDPADMAWVDLVALVRDSWRNVDTGEVALELSDLDGLQAWVAPSPCRQVVENLVRNAVEHGGPDVTTVRVGPLPSGDGFYVEDDGRGIPAADRDDVFERGVSSGAGFGIGLFIVKQVADDHGWTVRVTEGDRGGARIEVSDVHMRR